MSTRVWDEWVTERNSLPINDSDSFVVAPNSGILKTLHCNQLFENLGGANEQLI